MYVLMNNKVREKKIIFIGLKIDDVKFSIDFCVWYNVCNIIIF